MIAKAITAKYEHDIIRDLKDDNFNDLNFRMSDVQAFSLIEDTLILIIFYNGDKWLARNESGLLNALEDNIR